MADDLVQELRDWAAIVEEAVKQQVRVHVLNLDVCAEAADEIERLQSVAAELVRVMRYSEEYLISDMEWDAALAAYDNLTNKLSSGTVDP